MAWKATCIQMMQHQADAVLSQANPVSATLYTVLDTTKNVRLISLSAMITWAVTQPTPLEVVVTIDGVSIVYSVVNPGSAVPCGSSKFDGWTANQSLFAEYCSAPFLLEGRSVKVEARITWATTQPTPLACRVKYAKIP